MESGKETTCRNNKYIYFQREGLSSELTSAVWGQMSTGGGHTTLTETMAILGIPTVNRDRKVISGS